MKLTLQKGETIISVEMDEMDTADVFDSFVYALFGLGFSIEDIENQITKASQIIKNNHEPSNKDISTIRL